MKLIVGLGNPGNEYDNTPHNIGFSVIDYLANKYNISITQNKFNGKYGMFSYNNENIILLKPQSYMNLSGEVVIKFINYYKIELSDILIIHDDIDMNLGRIRFVIDSSNGGHNGIRNIEDHLHSKTYLRLKLGVSTDNKNDAREFVLHKFNSDNLTVINDIYKKLDDLIDDFCTKTVSDLMNKYNNK